MRKIVFVLFVVVPFMALLKHRLAIVKVRLFCAGICTQRLKHLLLQEIFMRQRALATKGWNKALFGIRSRFRPMGT